MIPRVPMRSVVQYAEMVVCNRELLRAAADRKQELFPLEFDNPHCLSEDSESLPIAQAALTV